MVVVGWWPWPGGVGGSADLILSDAPLVCCAFFDRDSGWVWSWTVPKSFFPGSPLSPTGLTVPAVWR